MCSCFTNLESYTLKKICSTYIYETKLVQSTCLLMIPQTPGHKSSLPYFLHPDSQTHKLNTPGICIYSHISTFHMPTRVLILIYPNKVAQNHSPTEKKKKQKQQSALNNITFFALLILKMIDSNNTYNLLPKVEAYI